MKLKKKKISSKFFIETDYSYSWVQRAKNLPLHDPVFLKIIDLLKINPGEMILEIGTGEGRFIKIILNNQAEYFGIDVSFIILRYAKLKARNYLVNLICADASYLPFKDKSIDKCFSYNTFYFIENDKEAIEEILRVTKFNVVIEAKYLASIQIFMSMFRHRIYKFALRTLRYLISNKFSKLPTIKILSLIYGKNKVEHFLNSNRLYYYQPFKAQLERDFKIIKKLGFHVKFIYLNKLKFLSPTFLVMIKRVNF
jgi:ubiquinone/menaquinone biosynthesis C-methylase UbiE